MKNYFEISRLGSLKDIKIYISIAVNSLQEAMSLISCLTQVILSKRQFLIKKKNLLACSLPLLLKAENVTDGFKVKLMMNTSYCKKGREQNSYVLALLIDVCQCFAVSQ